MDDDQLKKRMLHDPRSFLEISWRNAGPLGNDFCHVYPYNRTSCGRLGGHRYIMARRPGLYKDIIGQAHESEQKVVWL